MFNGGGVRTGTIGNCTQCQNKSEINIYPGDNPQPICENCYRDNQKLELRISGLDKNPTPIDPFISAVKNVLPSESANLYEGERELYLSIIQNADQSWVDNFIKEVVIKQVLTNDWKEIIKNKRWFSLLDLRRFALQVNPDFEKPITKKQRSKKAKGVTNVCKSSELNLSTII